MHTTDNYNTTVGVHRLYVAILSCINTNKYLPYKELMEEQDSRKGGDVKTT